LKKRKNLENAKKHKNELTQDKKKYESEAHTCDTKSGKTRQLSVYRGTNKLACFS
jgi:hypothetical protein